MARFNHAHSGQNRRQHLLSIQESADAASDAFHPQLLPGVRRNRDQHAQSLALVAEAAGRAVPPEKPIVGSAAFRHEYGNQMVLMFAEQLGEARRSGDR